MQVSVDGLRRNLARAYTKAVSGYREAIDANGFDSSFEQLKEGLDDMRQMIGAMFCMYSTDPEDMFSDMADEADALPFADQADQEEYDEDE
jgi:hypothetical protein